MVKVWYEPPPFGPRTALNRPAYGIGGDKAPRWLVQISKMPEGRVIAAAVTAFCVLGYLPLFRGEKLPYTHSPEYQAAQRAYMRYHNMNPIWGISSKSARAADEAH